MRLFYRFLVCAFISLGATSANAYPPKPQDWVTLGENNHALIGAWNGFASQVDVSSTGGDLKAMQAELGSQMGGVNIACGKIRDQIGMGGLFGPDMWTKGFAQTCWALASFQKASEHTFVAKMCGETKDAINFFRAFKPKAWPADYPQAEADVASFIEINNALREVLFASGAKECKAIKP